MIEQSKTCPFDKLRAGSELCRRIENLKSEGFTERAGTGGESDSMTKTGATGWRCIHTAGLSAF